MRPVIGVFAHPDDEIFAGGTLASLAKKRDVYLVCVTNGEAGINSSSKKAIDLGAIRQEELRASAESLGVKSVIFLEFSDNALSNSMFGRVAGKLRAVVEKIDPEILLTFEPRGVTGHLDHSFTSNITSYVFQKLPSVAKLWYLCFDKAAARDFRKYFEDFFIFIPPGYIKKDISKTIKVASVWDQKIASMKQYESQKHDIAKVVEMVNKQKKEENFIILSKDTV